ncbi:uncharacterized protein LOC127836643 [Dreissena polymorpha]|uniref:Uncharacterized protein n=1 Tax=Dreissena polymorpha TaxID=45954 RepID=A0A9D4GF18_DREPO|nr:uncharacterized protein LOC127836643 [Dreissena polymorpha]XP_052219285.1 uncharacterized protein LOC127836643 [Dreissena polymorpha]KAH3812807.1 hypothetical protein DPMN_141246 [Dreissena polymorpha]
MSRACGTNSHLLITQTNAVILELLVSVDIKQTGDDKDAPFLDGLDFLPDGRLVAVDSLNSKCIIMDDSLQIQTTPYKLNSAPNDVVCLSQGELAVTTSDKTVLLLSMSPGNVIRLTKKIKTSTYVDSICCMTPTDMVVGTFNHSSPARMITHTGVESDFDHVLFEKKTYRRDDSKCTYVPSKNTLVLTDRSAHTVYLYDTVKGKYKVVTDDNIRRPRSACVGPGDTVLVCSEAKNSVVHLTVEGDILGTFPLDMQGPWALCMNNNGTRLAVSNRNKKIQLFNISPAMT